MKKNRGYGKLEYIDFKPENDSVDLAVGEALVKIKAGSVCGSDVHAYKDVADYSRLNLPRIFGHESSGVIEQINTDGVESPAGLSVNDAVIIDPLMECGECSACKLGFTNVCYNRKTLGFQLNGVFSEYTKVKLDHLIKQPKGLNHSLASLTEPLTIAINAVKRSNLNFDNKDQDIVLFGSGKISLFIGLVLRKIKKMERVSVVGTSEDERSRLPHFAAAGIDTYVYEENFDKTGNLLHDSKLKGKQQSVFEVSGTELGLTGAMNTVKNTGNVILVGLFETPVSVVASNIVRTEKNLVGSYGSKHEDFVTGLEYISQGLIDKKVVSNYKPEDCNNAFEDYLNKRVISAIFEF